MQIIVILYSLFLTLKSQKSIIVHVACKNAKKQLKRLKMLHELNFEMLQN